MKRITAIFLIILLACSVPVAFSEEESSVATPAEVNQAETKMEDEKQDYYPIVITLIAELANMSYAASLCETQLQWYAKEAIEGKECRQFTDRFFELWPEPNALGLEIVDMIIKIERGEVICDADCLTTLLRAEEMRINIEYVLDYIEYTNSY